MKHPFCPLLAAAALLASGCARKATEGASGAEVGLSDQDADNGFVLRLTVDKREYREGETIKATASLENVTDEPMAVHFLDIRPMYVWRRDEKLLDLLIPCEETWQGWRHAYHNPDVLGLPSRLGFIGSTVGVVELDPDREAMKKRLASQLSDTPFRGPYPLFTVPARCTITTTRVYTASKLRYCVDVGLFGVKDFYAAEDLAKSGKFLERTLDGKYHMYPKIWLGALYVCHPIVIK